jgi:hypothetical protein
MPREDREEAVPEIKVAGLTQHLPGIKVINIINLH